MTTPWATPQAAAAATAAFSAPRRPAATGWLRIALLGAPFILITMAGNGWMRGVQENGSDRASYVASRLRQATAASGPE